MPINEHCWQQLTACRWWPKNCKNCWKFWWCKHRGVLWEVEGLVLLLLRQLRSRSNNGWLCWMSAMLSLLPQWMCQLEGWKIWNCLFCDIEWTLWNDFLLQFMMCKIIGYERKRPWLISEVARYMEGRKCNPIVLINVSENILETM